MKVFTSSIQAYYLIWNKNFRVIAVAASDIIKVRSKKKQVLETSENRKNEFNGNIIFEEESNGNIEEEI